jgi:hypothetical protein
VVLPRVRKRFAYRLAEIGRHLQKHLRPIAHLELLALSSTPRSLSAMFILDGIHLVDDLIARRKRTPHLRGYLEALKPQVGRSLLELVYTLHASTGNVVDDEVDDCNLWRF